MCQKCKIIFLCVLLFGTQNIFAAKPYGVAGSFYPKEKKELSSAINSYLEDAKLFESKNTQALIVPHAGYIYSASVAAQGYKNLNKEYKNIFIIGSSHYTSYNGASIYNKDDYETPLGVIKSNQKIIKRLMQISTLFSFHKKAHQKEHTIEVQLPFLQTVFGSELKIVPIILGTNSTKTIKAIADALSPYFNDENLFIISSDLSHYPAYDDANSIDKETINAILQNDPNSFIETLAKHQDHPKKDFATSACGWSSILTLLYLTKDQPYKYQLLQYKNSGDTKYADKRSVVGYAAIRVYKEGFSLTKNEKKELLDIAQLALYEITLNHTRVTIDKTKISPKLKQHIGVFVTLHKNHNLRGCIGRFEPNKALYQVVIDMAIAAAQNDSRFTKVTPDELKDIELEISVLTPRTPIRKIDELKLGVDGIFIQKGSHSGTFLPQVAIDMNWSKEQFAGYCAQEKANIGYEGYKDAKLFKYQTIIFDQNTIK